MTCRGWKATLALSGVAAGAGEVLQPPTLPCAEVDKGEEAPIGVTGLAVPQGGYQSLPDVVPHPGSDHGVEAVVGGGVEVVGVGHLRATDRIGDVTATVGAGIGAPDRADRAASAFC